MKGKVTHRVIIVVSVLMFFMLFFETIAMGFDIENHIYSKSGSDLSGTPVEINIVSPQVILQGKEMQMMFETSNSATYVPVKWSSSNPDVISCTSDGKIKGLIKGKATITVKVQNGKSSDSITVYCAKRFEEPETAKTNWPFFVVNRTPVFWSFENVIFNFAFLIPTFPFSMDIKVEILGYYDDYFYVEYKYGEELRKGLVWSVFFADSAGSKEIFRQISYNSIVLKTGESSAQRLTTQYKGKVTWTVSDKNVISFDQNTGKITAKKPGIAMITAKAGTTKKSCTVYSVSQWLEPETAVATKDVTVRETPSATGDKVGTVLKGTVMTADGDFENGTRWVHVESGDTDGFVHLDNFPGINYLMTEYHYYDQGFEKRFGSGFDKIREYSSVMNDIMMRIFGLKINQHIESYTSLADECKIKTYGSVNETNLRANCPKTEGHIVTSCLFDYSLRNELIKDKDKGTNVIGHCIWSGHCLENNPRSSTTPAYNTIIFTVRRFIEYNTQTNSFYNKSDGEMRDEALYLIVHETAHLLGVVDGYCERDGGFGHCSNENCYECDGLTVPDCIMVNNTSNPENRTAVFCEECIEIINNHLSNHH